MTESSGCDPQLAVRARRQAVDTVAEGLKRLLVDGEKADDWFENLPHRDPGDETDYKGE